MASKFFNTDTDTTLGGSNTSDSAVSSQKAVKTYVDNHHDSTKQDALTEGDGISISDNTISTNNIVWRQW